MFISLLDYNLVKKTPWQHCTLLMFLDGESLSHLLKSVVPSSYSEVVQFIDICYYSEINIHCIYRPIYGSPE